MEMTSIYEGSYQWVMFGRDENKPEKIIDTNQCMVRTANRCLLIDPGGGRVVCPDVSSRFALCAC
jgi:hypothetical protein